MVNFVKEAVAFAKIYGKQDALMEYKDKHGLFVRGELYIYAYDLNCKVLSHGSPRRSGGSIKGGGTIEPAGKCSMADGWSAKAEKGAASDGCRQ